jgi:hypothetical protein
MGKLWEETARQGRCPCGVGFGKDSVKKRAVGCWVGRVWRLSAEVGVGNRDILRNKKEAKSVSVWTR